MPRGRKPKPVEVKKAEAVNGRHPGHRPIPNDAPAADGNRPPKPPHIQATKAASAAWDELCEHLEKLGVMSTTDAAAMARLAQLEGMMSDAYAMILKDGTDGRIATVVKLSNNVAAPHPAIAIYNKAAALARPLYSEFGLTPSARARVKVNKIEEDEDDFGDLGGKRA